MFEVTPRAGGLKEKREALMDCEVYPNEARFFKEPEKGGAWAAQPSLDDAPPCGAPAQPPAAA